jgi:hypothetical protein
LLNAMTLMEGLVENFTAGVLVALALGWFMGWFAERARRNRSDYVKTKTSIPGLRKTYLSSILRASRFIFLVALGLAALIMGLARGGEG